MNRNSINFIIGLMGIALLGVISMQFYYLKQSYQLKSQLFDQSVNEALTNVVNKLERQEAYNFLNKSIQLQSPVNQTAPIPKNLKNTTATTPSIKSQRQFKYARLLKLEQQKADSIFNIRDSLLRTRYPYVYALNDGSIEVPQMNLQIDVAEYEDIFGNVHQQMISRLTPHQQPVSKKNALINNNQIRTDSVKKYLVINSRGNYEIIERLKPVITTLSQKGLKELEKREPIARKAARKIIDSVQIEEKKDVFQDLATELQQANIPLSKRIHPKSLDSLLRLELLNRGINIDYDYMVSSAKGNSVIFTKTADKTSFLPNNTYKTVLFPKDVFRDAGMLMVTFPARKSILLSNLTAMMASSGALLVILILCFGFTLHLILRQKKDI